MPLNFSIQKKNLTFTFVIKFYSIYNFHKLQIILIYMGAIVSGAQQINKNLTVLKNGETNDIFR